MNRKLAYVVKIKDVSPIKNSDNLEVVSVKGWKVVVQKNQFNKDDLAVFFEIDSWIPSTILPPDSEKTYYGIFGSRLRTMKFRGQISQGLLKTFDSLNIIDKFEEDYDLTDILNIKLWETTITNQGDIIGSFPEFISKTDKERCQNIDDIIFNNLNFEYEITEKLDGVSMTVYYNNGETGVCAKNTKRNPIPSTGFFAHTANRLKLLEKLQVAKLNIALQGEIFNNDFYCFDVWDIDNQKYFDNIERYQILEMLAINDENLVPIIHNNISLLKLNIMNMDKLLLFANGKSKLSNKKREGLVFKKTDATLSFKVISNEYLLKNKE